jgi:predicted AlkP superfamily phosphohydrolase/phosphomutase
MEKNRKVCVIGLDGATFALIKPWVEEGKLPHFRRLMEESSFGDLESTIPAHTPTAWTTSVTGQNAGQHNLYTFFRLDRENYRRILTNHGDRRAKAVWNILSEEGKQVGIVGVPFTYPVEKVNGFMVSGSPLPSTSTDHTYPPSLLEEIIEKVPGYKLWSDLHARGEEALLEEIYRQIDVEIALVTYLLGAKSWDFFMGVLIGLDVVQHLFWRHMDRSHPHFHPGRAKKLGPGILNCYQRVDRFLGDVLRELGKEVPLVIYSDHGFGPLHKYFYITNWLLENGFLALKEEGDLKRRKKVGSLIYRMGINRLKPFVPLKLLKKVVQHAFPGYHHLIPLIDWNRTKAFFPTVAGQSIYINMRGRESAGIVPPGNACEEVKQTLTEKLDEWVKSGVIDKIHRREAIYDGTYVENAPDLIIEMGKGYQLQEGLGPALLTAPMDGVTLVSGQHRKEGIFLIRGEGVKEGVEIKSARIIDVAPTLLYLHGIPIPRAMEGHVLKEAFDTAHLPEKAVKFDDRDMRRESGYVDFSEEGKEEILKKLKALGYVE